MAWAIHMAAGPLDSQENVYVTDSGSHRVSIFG